MNKGGVSGALLNFLGDAKTCTSQSKRWLKLVQPSII